MLQCLAANLFNVLRSIPLGEHQYFSLNVCLFGRRRPYVLS